MVGVRTPFEDEGVDQAAVEPDLGPDARLGVVGQLGRHEVVELAVQVRHRQHGQHPSHGLVLGLLSGRGHAVGVADTADTCDTVRPAKKPAVIRSNEAA
ncbi:Uncharacterised protein [Mycobacteroides abscessus subsp. abscessus]|nr:Uncharacterised protein [Mycobacteroides abscessus subsp. abscessus]